ncbi:PREDICTED: uncharacterized protein LOC109582889 [Amphimedon queenslandica]|uniref:Nucleoside phosphorylase domain-containing protein n=2 Tax=Amphimedon queenslandica TaxID=400682 RepID=A0A1X7UKZ1_AMPQE|nr:PREDICTED: uncharacterized protein LOC109582889 [Amphimedon queenslandica]XP_019853501.1 PREDICTED: uncharacterized protein LOC109582889 [Amphimedon queenslandica]|eukprot:XP_019853500.1 PREDICTED: uncharacterized protein LOC109582889 [Amphimedon queenslandica]
MLNLIFLLLLLSGDVELNPGPLTGQDPRDILREKSFSLSQAISNNLAQVAGILHEKKLIPQQAKANVSILGVQDYEKASRLVGVLEMQLSASDGNRQKYLIDVCNALNELKDTKLTEHANAMLKALGISSGSTQRERIVPMPAVPITSGGIEETDHPNGCQGATATQSIVVPDPPDVKSEECPPMAKIKPKNCTCTPDLIADVNIILVTATKKEYRAVMGTGTRIEGDEENYTRVELDDVSFNLVMYGSYKVAVIRTDQGPKTTEAKLEKIQAVIKAQYVIAVGICYGMKESKTKLGDIIVAKSIKDTSSRRASDHELSARPEEYKCGEKLYATFENDEGFELETKKDEYVLIHCGTLVSENTLVASQKYKEDILKQIPQALGGEMEGVGVMTAAEKGKYEGIVIKAIADWGNEEKEPYRKWQEFAAVGAAKYVLYHLEATEKFKKQ